MSDNLPQEDTQSVEIPKDGTSTKVEENLSVTEAEDVSVDDSANIATNGMGTPMETGSGLPYTETSAINGHPDDSISSKLDDSIRSPEKNSSSSKSKQKHGNYITLEEFKQTSYLYPKVIYKEIQDAYSSKLASSEERKKRYATKSKEIRHSVLAEALETVRDLNTRKREDKEIESVRRSEAAVRAHWETERKAELQERVKLEKQEIIQNRIEKIHLNHNNRVEERQRRIQSLQSTYSEALRERKEKEEAQKAERKRIDESKKKKRMAERKWNQMFRTHVMDF
eukprot:g2182.t1